ncbi:MAG: RICIN domain-containing protein [Actinomycetota bacterium]|nr:RICIN domain-containing protein [Actinomycetota bacterium]
MTVATTPAEAAVIDTNASYVLVNRHSGKVLDVAGTSTADGAAIQQWSRNDGAWQQFQFVSSGSGFYRLKARHSGKVLDLWEWNTADGAEYRQWPDLNAANQQFQILDSDSGYVRLINRHSNKALEVWDWSTADGGRISQYADLNGWNQQWQLAKVGNAPSTPAGGPAGWAGTNGGTTGGGSGPTVTVTNASALTSALQSSTAQTIRISGMISVSGMQRVASNKTILGVGANSGLNGGGLTMSRVQNIIIRNLNFANSSDDAINIQDGSHHIWIDHNTFSNAADGLVDIRLASDFITVSWNITRSHDKTMLLGSDDSNTGDRGKLRVTYHHNWFQGTNQRHPRVRFGNPVHVLNNYYSNIGSYGVASTTEAGVLVEGNYFENVSRPTTLAQGSSPNGNLVQRNNVFVNSGTPMTSGSVASIPYAYTVDPPNNVKGIVTAGAGTGKLGL